MKNVLASIAAVSVVGGAVAEVAQAAPNEAQTTSVAAVQQDTQTTNECKVNADVLHVRQGPSTSDSILGLVKQGEALHVLGEVQGWYKVEYNGQTAYVSKDFVTTTTAVTPNKEYTVTVSSLRVRQGPSTAHEVIGGLTKGEVVQVVGELKNWYKISYEGQTAYVSKDYIARPDSPAPAVETVQSGGNYIVDVPSLRIRTGAAVYHPVIGGVMQGQALHVIGVENGWYKIDRNGSQGYVSAQYVTFVPNHTDYYVTSGGLNMRTGAGVQSDIIDTISFGQKVQVIGEESGWFKISYNNQIGFINKKYVSQEKAAADQESDSEVQDQTQSKQKSNASVQTQAKTSEQAQSQSQAEAKTLVQADQGKTQTKAPAQAAQQVQVQSSSNTEQQSKEQAPAQPEPKKQVKAASTVEQQPAEDYYITISSLNVRSGAGTQNDVIGSVSYGDKVQVIGEESGWFKISYNGQTGFIGKSYTSKTKVADQSAASQTPSTPKAQEQQQTQTQTQVQPQAKPQSQSKPSSNVSSLTSYAESLVGTPYVWGGTTPNGFDCSGFIYHVYNKFGFSFGRQSVAGYWSSFSRTSNPQTGDLVYFQNTYQAGASHMGIYLGNGTFVHAGDNGVEISSIDNPYWSSHFLGYTKAY